MRSWGASNAGCWRAASSRKPAGAGAGDAQVPEDVEVAGGGPILVSPGDDEQERAGRHRDRVGVAELSREVGLLDRGPQDARPLGGGAHAVEPVGVRLVEGAVDGEAG